jgi:SOS response regulatory protein OraA/RecX
MNQDSALWTSLKALQRRDFLSAELDRFLDQRGYEPEQKTTVMAQLANWGFLNDERVIENFINYRQNKLYGKLKILAELEQKGAPIELAQLIESRLAPEVELENANKLLAKKFSTDDVPIKGARYLASRGYEEATIVEAVESYFSTSLDIP